MILEPPQKFGAPRSGGQPGNVRLRAKGISPSSYFLAYERQGLATPGLEDIPNTWLMALKQLDENALGAMKVSAFCSSSPIPLKILKSADLRLPIQLGLGQFDTTTRSFTVHRLVQAAIREHIGPSERASWSEEALRAMYRSMSGEHSGYKGDKLSSIEVLPHCLACLDYMVADHIDLSSIQLFDPKEAGHTIYIFGAGVIPAMPVAAEFMVRAALEHAGRDDETARSLLNRAIEIAEKALGTEHHGLVPILVELAWALHRMNRNREAAQIVDRALDAHEPKENEAVRLFDVAGRVRVANGQYAEGITMLRRALKTYKTQRDKSLVFALLVDIGRAQLSDTRFKEAEATLRDALFMDVASASKTYATVGLGVALAGQKRRAEAENCFRQTIAWYEQNRGTEDSKYADALNSFAALLMDQGRYREAADSLQIAVAIAEKNSEDDVTLASKLANLAAAYTMLARSPEAGAIFRKALFLYERSLGPEHLKTAMCHYNLGHLYKSVGRFDDAEREFLLAMPVVQKQCGPRHPYVSAVRESLRNLRSESTDSATTPRGWLHRNGVYLADRVRGWLSPGRRVGKS